MNIMCLSCKNKDSDELPPYFYRLITLYNLKESGYPFQPNDLTIDQWLSFGIIKQKIEELKWATNPGSK